MKKYKIKKSARVLKFSLFSVVFLFVLGCGTNNLFKSYSKQDSDEALVEDAKVLIDNGDYAGALTKLNLVTVGYRGGGDEQKKNFYETRAAAYAGQCGLIFTTFTSKFSGSGNFIAKARNAFLGLTVEYTSCASAQADIEALGTKTQRTTNQNFFLAILGLAKMGTVLRSSSDTDNDGTADSTWTACKVDDKISTDQVKFAFTGLGLLIDNIGAIGSAVSGLNTTDITNFDSSCATSLGISSCAFTDINAVTDTMALLFRKILDASDTGVGTCDTSGGNICCISDL